jgi:hypothetical protein
MISNNINFTVYRKLLTTARELRRKEADRNFINSLPLRLRLALEFYIGDGGLGFIEFS